MEQREQILTKNCEIHATLFRLCYWFLAAKSSPRSPVSQSLSWVRACYKAAQDGAGGWAQLQKTEARQQQDQIFIKYSAHLISSHCSVAAAVHDPPCGPILHTRLHPDWGQPATTTTSCSVELDHHPFLLQSQYFYHNCPPRWPKMWKIFKKKKLKKALKTLQSPK